MWLAGRSMLQPLEAGELKRGHKLNVSLLSPILRIQLVTRSHQDARETIVSVPAARNESTFEEVEPFSPITGDEVRNLPTC